MKLQRKWARVICVLLMLTCLCMFLPVVAYDLLDADSILWGCIGVGGTLICFSVSIYLRWKFLACPNCGKGVAVPRWKPGKRGYCSCCGQPFVFDDEETGEKL
jgi:hypothetical protein